MNCPHCHANLEKRNAKGETLLKARGWVIKAGGVVAICPRCKGDVPATPDVMQQLHRTAVLFFRNR